MNTIKNYRYRQKKTTYITTLGAWDEREAELEAAVANFIMHMTENDGNKALFHD
jgi:hypothetical protein